MSDFGLNVALGGTSFLKKRNQLAKDQAAAAKELQDRLNEYKVKKEIDLTFDVDPKNVELKTKSEVYADAVKLAEGDLYDLPQERGIQESEKTSAEERERINYLSRIDEGTGLTNRDIIAQSKAEDLKSDIGAGVPTITGATTALTDMAREAVSLGLPKDANAEQIRERREFFSRLTDKEKRAFDVGLPITASMDEIVKSENIAEGTKKVDIANTISGTNADPDLEKIREKRAQNMEITEQFLNQLTVEGYYGDGITPVIDTTSKPGVQGVLDRYEISKAASDFAASQAGGVRIPLDKDTLKRYNKWAGQTGVKAINPDLPYLLLRTIDDPIYKDRDENRVAIELINQYGAIPNEVFNGMPPQKRNMIERKLERQLNNLWRTYNVFEKGSDGSEIIPTTTQFNWDGIGIQWKNLPNWVHRKTKKLVQSRIPEPENIIRMVEQDNGSTSMEVQSSEISSEDVVEIQEAVPDSAIAMEDAAVLLHAKNSNLSPNQIRGDASEEKEALAYVGTNRDSVIGNMILHPMLYMSNTSLTPRKLPLEGKRRDAILIKVNDHAVKKSRENKPPVMGMTYDPRTYHTAKLEMFSSAIDNGYIVSELKRARIGGSTTSGFVNQGMMVDVNTIADIYGIDIKEARNATTFSDPAYSTGIALIKSLDETGVGSSLSELLAIVRSGITTLPQEFSRVLGNWVEDGATYNINKESKLETALTNDVSKYTANYKGENAVQLRGTVNKVLTDANTYFQDGQGDTLAPKIAKQKMLHSALVFYTAAAFQGEGGKAISDGDRKFVEWALGYGLFSNVKTRQAAIMGMLAIIAKADTINKYMSSGNTKKMFVAANYNQIHGENSINPEDWKLTGIKDTRGDFTNINAPRLLDESKIFTEDVGFMKTIEKANQDSKVATGLVTQTDNQDNRDMKGTFEAYTVTLPYGFVTISPNMKPKDINNVRAQLEAFAPKNTKIQEALNQFNIYYK